MSDTNNKQGNDNLGQTEIDQQLQSHQSTSSHEQQDNPLTHSSDEADDANQSNAARNAVDDGDNDSSVNYRDRNRSTSTRANEASDRLDTGSGGLGAGGGHSAGEIK